MRRDNEYSEESHAVLNMKYDAAIRKAQVLIGVAKWDSAQVHLRKALMEDPESALAHYYVSFCYFKKKQYGKAEKEAKLALSLSPDYAAAYGLLGWIALMQNKYSDALKATESAIRLNPTEASYYVIKATVHIDSYNIKQALEAAEDALRLDPINEAAGSIRTLALTALNRRAEADEQANAVMSTSPGSSLAWYQKGLQLFSCGKLDEARDAVLESLRLEPEDQETQSLLIKIMSARKGFLSKFWRFYLWWWSMPRFARVIILITVIALLFVQNSIIHRYPATTPFLSPMPFVYMGFFILARNSIYIFNFVIRKGWIK